MRRRQAKKHHILARLLAALAWIFLAFSGMLWILDNAVPGFAKRRLEQQLSAGPVAVSFEKVSFNPFSGLALKNVRIHRKRSLAMPLVKASEIRLGFTPSLARPWRTWADSVHCINLVVAPYDEWEDFICGEGADSENEGVDFGEFLKSLSGEDGAALPIVHFSAENAEVMLVRTRFVEFDISAPNGNLELGGISIVPDAVGYIETLKGALSFAPENSSLEVSLAGTLTPQVIRDLTLSLDGAVAVEYYDAISGIQNPFAVSGEISLCDMPDGGSLCDIRLTLSGSDFLYRGVSTKNVKMGLQWLTDSSNLGAFGRRLVISPLDATFDEGRFSGRLAWYPQTHATDLHAKSGLPVKRLFTVIDLPMPPSATNVIFATPPRAEVSGRVFPKGFGHDFFYGTVSAANATVRRAPLQDISASWGYEEANSLVFVHDVKATCSDGVIEASFDAVTTNDCPFSLKLSAAEVKTDPLRRIFDPGAPSSDGRLGLEMELTGNLATNTLQSLCGKAHASLRNAAITRIPLFAGLTDFMARNVAGIDLLVMQSDSDITLSATNGLVSVERMTVDGNMLSMVSRGKWRLDKPGMPIEGVSQVRFFHSRSLMGILARIVTLPVSKLMEFRVYGPFEKPKWDYIGLIDRLAEATFWPRKDATQ